MSQAAEAGRGLALGSPPGEPEQHSWEATCQGIRGSALCYPDWGGSGHCGPQPVEADCRGHESYPVKVWTVQGSGPGGAHGWAGKTVRKVTSPRGDVDSSCRCQQAPSASQSLSFLTGGC